MGEDYDFDPWDTEDESTVEVMDRAFPATLYNRARSRVQDVERLGARLWVVRGRKGDRKRHYEVRLVGTEYECDCQSLEYGDVRARRGCSHVLAVMIVRAEAQRQVELRSDGGDGEQGETRASRDGVPNVPAQLRLVAVPSISDPRWVEFDATPLPAKFQTLRDHQWTAVQQALEAYERGAEVVWLDAPTGTGKSLVAELIRRMLKARAFYVCHSKTLQGQFLADFPYARLLMGRSNYPTLDEPDATCDDCTKSDPMDDCVWCSMPTLCPYQVAKREAKLSHLAILNTSYFLTEANYVGESPANRGLGIMDECDVIEDELMGFVDFHVSERMLGRLKIRAPKEGSHRTTIGTWFLTQLKPRVYDVLKQMHPQTLEEIRDRQRMMRLYGDVERICGAVQKDEGLTGWVRDVKAGPMTLKPVTVNEWGQQLVWRHAPKWLCMSGTIISAQELSLSTGLDKEWDVVTVPMTFPVENRRIILAPVADMGRKGKEAGDWALGIRATVRIAERHASERILVHTVSYELARLCVDELHRALGRRPVLTYRSAGERDRVLSRFRNTPGAILVAPSLDRGVDLAEDECRVVVVLKIPFPNLGDRQIGERMRMPDGDAWYAAKMVRSLVQMTGRAVRSDRDWCVSYILDRQMVRDSKNRGGVLKRHRMLLPQWWRDALVTDFPVRQLMEGAG